MGIGVIEEWRNGGMEQLRLCITPLVHCPILPVVRSIFSLVRGAVLRNLSRGHG